MRLFIAEKPSLAQTIAKALGSASRGDGYIETAGGIVTWCFGHLYEQADPDEYTPDDVPRNLATGKKIWRLEDIPILPQQWKLVPRPDSAKQIGVIRQLLKQTQEVVNAGDPDREGQLLVDEVLEELNFRGAVRRVWLQDLSDAGVRKALSKLENNEKYQGLKQAAETRSRVDWLVGMNLTRVYSLKAQGNGYRGVLSVGRVQTPTLALVVNRDREIENFKPLPYFTLAATFQAKAGVYPGIWMVPEDRADPEGRCLDKSLAAAVAAKIGGKPGTVIEAERQQKKEGAPLPFSLSKLQAYASAKWGMSAQRVLDVAQSLYETHKITTYPRTDCEYLAENQHGDAAGILGAIAKAGKAYADLVQGANTKIKSRAFDDKKISAHTGIIPTSKAPDMSALSADEAKIYDAVVRRYLAQFYSDHEYLATRIITECEGERFKTTGKTPVKAGWRALYAGDDEPENKRKDDEEEDANTSLPSVSQGEGVKCSAAKVQSKETKPPARFTEGTLIAAMAGVAKFVSDPVIKAKLKETSGIGTEATRAGIIETLKKRGFLVNKGKQILSTESARSFIDLLPMPLKDPGTTALWEQALEGIVAGRVPPDKFMQTQTAWLVKQVHLAKEASITVAGGQAEGPKCPQCCTGSLRRIKGAKGFFWGCSRYKDGCKASFEDKRGKPDMGGASKKPSPARKAPMRKRAA